MEMAVNTSDVVKSCYFQHTSSLESTRPFFRKTKDPVVNALGTSRPDYYKSLMHGTTQHNLDKQQRVQNSVAGLILGKFKFDYMIKILVDLHWLPIRAQTSYKIGVGA